MKQSSVGIYAGDDAWREWFEVCFVDGCRANVLLRKQVESAMLSRLYRYGLTRDDIGSDDPVAVFDAYFKLKGARDTPKPLKQYFAYRIEVEKLRMVDFVCGTLFGRGSGRIHDIVLDWVASIKGWRVHSVRSEDGRRTLQWENSGEGIDGDLGGIDGFDPADLIDVEHFNVAIEKMLEKISSKIKVEKSKVALLCYVMAQDIPLTEAAVLDGLGVAKSRAYTLRDKTIEALRRELKHIDGAEGALFARVLMERCEANLSDDMRVRLGGKNENK